MRKLSKFPLDIDWRDSKSYEYTRELTGCEWAWEFLRRNKNYAMDWARAGQGALGMEKDIGSLEIGKKADLIVVDMTGADWIPRYNPIQNLIYSASGNSVETVVIDGKIVMEHWEIKTVDEKAVLRKCQDLSKEVLRRSGVTAFDTPWKVV